MKRYVVGFLFTTELMKAVYLIRKERPEWQRGRYNGIGGHVEEGESYLHAMIREFEEETGVHIESWHEYVIYKGIGENEEPYELHFFWDILKEEDPLPRSMTDEVVVTNPVNQLNYPWFISNLRWLIPMAVDNVYAEINEIPLESWH